MSYFLSALLRRTEEQKETATCRLARALDLAERTLRNLFRVRRGPAAKLTVQFFRPLTSLSTWWVGCRHRGVTLLWAITPLLGRDASQPHRLFFFSLIQQEEKYVARTNYTAR